MRSIELGHSRAVGVQRESTSLTSRVALVVFCLAAGLIYRASVSLIPGGVAEDAFVLALAALLLVLALLARRSDRFRKYWEIPFAFFVFTAAGFFGDGSISPLQHFFVRNVLNETTSTNNPLASTVGGSVLAQLFGTLVLVIPIIALTMASGASLSSIFIARPTAWWTVVVAMVLFVVIFFLASRGRTESFFPTHGSMTASRL